MIGHWRRFRPQIRGKLSDKTVYEEDSIYARARLVVDDMMRQARSGLSSREHFEQSIKAAKLLRAHEVHDGVQLLALLILQSPNAAHAQEMMDTHHGGYSNREARLFELIDFNDTFVDTVLTLDDAELPNFTTRLKAEMDTFCERVHANDFTDKQYEAIVHGLSREIAVYRAAKQLGYQVRMTSRVQDAKGIDMVITDPVTKKTLNVDVKTHSAFHFRLLDLEHQKRISEQRRLDCELSGYCTIQNGNHHHGVHTMLLRIATEDLGEIRDFEFVDNKAFAKLIRNALDDQGKFFF